MEKIIAIIVRWLRWLFYKPWSFKTYEMHKRVGQDSVRYFEHLRETNRLTGKTRRLGVK
ncbi:MAG: hypothetical protein V3U97_01225 [bacterium]